MKKGFVYLVGAGPGDPELITLKAVRAIKEADCIIYDYLADKGFVEDVDCEVIYVGKQGSSHTLTQEGINDLIVEKALNGKTVVRLKGGDPFIFGRGGEEAEILVDKGIDFCVIPGISSFYSAPAYAGIPVTHRDFSNAIEVISGHRRADADDGEDVNFPEYNSQKTFVFLMGMKNLSHIREKLIDEKGFPDSTPVGIISWGARPEQRVITAPLSNIVEKVSESGMKPPAIIVMGKVVSLRDKLQWFDNRPLFGKRIVVTRTRSQASKLSHHLSVLGARAIEFPTIKIEKVADMTPLHRAINLIEEYHWIIFTSQNAVNIFFEELFALGKDVRAMGNLKIAAIGKASGDELKHYGLLPDLVPDKFVAEELLRKMKGFDIQGSKILLPCSSEARMVLTEGLIEAGALVNRIHIYNAVKPSDISEEVIEEVKNADIITFTSSSTVNNFFSIIPETSAIIASIGPITTETIRERGLSPHIEADEYTVNGLVDSIIEFYSKNK